MLFKIVVSEENHRPFESELTVDKYTLKMKTLSLRQLVDEQQSKWIPFTEYPCQYTFFK